MGVDGALAISDLLWERGVRKFEFIVDEGLTVTNKIVLGMREQTALYVSVFIHYIAPDMKNINPGPAEPGCVLPLQTV